MRIASAPTTVEQRILAAALALPGSMVAATSAGVAHGLPVGSAPGSPIVSTASAAQAPDNAVASNSGSAAG